MPVTSGRGWFARQQETGFDGEDAGAGSLGRYQPSATRAAELHVQAMENLQPPFTNERTGRTLAYQAQFEATMLVYEELRALRKALKKRGP